METIENTLTPEEIERKRQYLIDEVNKGIDSPRSNRTFEEIVADVKEKYINNELHTLRSR